MNGAQAQRWRLSVNWLYPVIIGSGIAVMAALILMQKSALWAFLVPIGLAVLVGSLLAPDFKNYWLALFALVLPLEIRKMLIDSETVWHFIQTYGLPAGELPGPVIYLSDLPFLMLLCIWVMEIIFKDKKFFLPRGNSLALAFVAWSGLSLAKATSLPAGFFDFLRICKLYLFYLYIANNCASRDTIRLIFKYLLIGVVLQGIMCLYQYIGRDIGYIFGQLLGQKDFYSDSAIQKINPIFKVSEGGATLRRASGTVGLINAEAQFFEFLLPVTLLFLLLPVVGFSPTLAGIALLTGGAGLILTFSRGGFIGLACGFTAVILLGRLYKLLLGRKFLWLLLLGFSLSLAAIPFTYKFIQARPEAAQFRSHLNWVGLGMIKANPILGVGLNNHMIERSNYDDKAYVFPMPTHNQYLLMGSEIGIPGVLFFLGFLAVTCKLALKAAKSQDRFQATVAVGILGGLAAIAVHILVDYLSASTNLTLLWLYAGLAAALSKNQAPL